MREARALFWTTILLIVVGLVLAFLIAGAHR